MVLGCEARVAVGVWWPVLEVVGVVWLSVRVACEIAARVARILGWFRGVNVYCIGVAQCVWPVCIFGSADGCGGLCGAGLLGAGCGLPGGTPELLWVVCECL